MTLNPMWPRTGNLISQFLFLNLWDESPSRSNLVIRTYQFPFKGKKCEKNIHESFSQVFFLFCERAPFQLLKPAKLFQIITLCHPCWLWRIQIGWFQIVAAQQVLVALCSGFQTLGCIYVPSGWLVKHSNSWALCLIH